MKDKPRRGTLRQAEWEREGDQAGIDLPATAQGPRSHSGSEQVQRFGSNLQQRRGLSLRQWATVFQGQMIVWFAPGTEAQKQQQQQLQMMPWPWLDLTGLSLLPLNTNYDYIQTIFYSQLDSNWNYGNTFPRQGRGQRTRAIKESHDQQQQLGWQAIGPGLGHAGFPVRPSLQLGSVDPLAARLNFKRFLFFHGSRGRAAIFPVKNKTNLWSQRENRQQQQQQQRRQPNGTEKIKIIYHDTQAHMKLAASWSRSGRRCWCRFNDATVSSQLSLDCVHFGFSSGAQLESERNPITF